jgi:pyrroline-5-carboxylate reductase
LQNANLKIGFIGGGNMASAIVAGLLRADHAPAALAVADPSAESRRKVAALSGRLRISSANSEVAAAAEVLVLAVKPQVMPAVLAEIAAVKRPAGQLVVSVAAGTTLSTLAQALGAGLPAVRIMPNQPALIGEGMSVLVASPAATMAHRVQALYIAEATGRALWIGEESLMDAVTAVSGSGPAYFYLLMEIMEESAVALGLPPDTARTLVRQTALGAARTAGASERTLADLRAAVTSPGGTTAAALAVLDQAGIRDALKRALTAARDRGAELGRGST